MNEKIFKNKYFIPVVIALIIALVGIIAGVSISKRGEEGGKLEKTVELKEKRTLKSLLFGKNDYDLSYANLDPSIVENISFFEAGENWQGNGFSDRRVFYQGESSIALTSQDHVPGIIFLERDLNLSNFKTLEVFVNISDPQVLESAAIKLGDSSLENYYLYTLSNLQLGWNCVTIPLEQFIAINNPQWSNIKKIQLEIVSRPKNAVVANFDYLVSQKTTDYLDKWNSVDKRFLSLAKEDNKVSLMGRNVGAYQVTLAEVTGARDFSFQASFIPKKAGRSGLFFRGDYKTSKGYYLVGGGVNSDAITLMKYGSDGWEDLAKISVRNFAFSEDKKYWLRVDTSDNQIMGFLSQDGENFTELLSIKDDEFLTGGIGIAALDGTYSLFDDLSFKQK